jgi:hypothetical protein
LKVSDLKALMPLENTYELKRDKVYVLSVSRSTLEAMPNVMTALNNLNNQLQAEGIRIILVDSEVEFLES